MIPCLHDESYAYMSILKARINSLKGIIFHAKPEYELAKRIYGLKNVKSAVLGEGIDTDWYVDCNPNAFREKFQIKDPFSFLQDAKTRAKKPTSYVPSLCVTKKNFAIAI